MPCCSVWPTMKEMQPSFSSSDDWIPGSSVAWNGLFCTSCSSLPILIPSSPHTRHLPAATNFLRLSLQLENETAISVGHRELYLQFLTTPCSPSLVSFPVSRIKFKRNQGNVVARFVWLLARVKSGFRLLSVEKGREQSEKTYPWRPPCSLALGLWGLAGQHYILSQSVSPHTVFSLHPFT